MPDTGSKNPASPIKWNFSTYKDAKGRTYVITYHNRWDCAKKQSRIAKRRHVGRLDDGTHEVALSEAYLADHPQYTGCHVFYEGKALVVRSDKEAEELTSSPL